MIVPIFLLFFLSQSTIASSSKFDNEIIGLPRVSCERDNIRVKVQTARPFEGRFFVKEQFHEEQCGRSFIDGRPVPRSKWEQNSVAHGSIRVIEGSSKESSQNQKLSEGSREKWEGFGFTVNPPRGRPSLFGIGGSRAATFSPDKGLDPSEESPLKSPTSCPSAEEICPPCVCEQPARHRREANWAELVVPLGACNAKRDRVMNPPSLVTSFVAIVSFHGNFITKIDRAYHIKCAFNESTFHVDTQLNVTMKDGSVLSGESQPPSCEYHLLGPDGAPLHHVKVGDLVRHEWSCTGPEHSKVLVHDCYAEDGQGTRQKVIDEFGCSLDQYAIPTPQYDEKGLTAHVDAFVFQFPDQASVSFQCGIRSCTGVDKNCQQLSPPHCGVNRRKRSSLEGEEAMTIHSPTLTVLDLDNSISPAALKAPAPSEPLCLSLTTFGAAISLTTFLLTASAGAVLVQCFYDRSL